MRTCTRAGAVCILGVLIAVGAGCAGPSKISRGFDERVNQLNVDNPTLAEIAWPVEVVGTVTTKVVDWCAVNPWFFWEDVFVGRGTPYYYKNPVVPELPPEEHAAGSSGDEARGGESSGELLSVSDPLDAPYYAPPEPAYAPAPLQYREPAVPVRTVAAIDVPPPAPRRETRAAAPARPPARSQARTHTVKRGDTLSGLALKYYGDADRWQAIYKANRKLLASPKALKPGQVLAIPAAR
ncbi:MAG TPA: hypothetical protein DCM87_03885 [Planctomycetes bacterium]|nr:hypothetical protein [Planctomycetota bacterium]